MNLHRTVKFMRWLRPHWRECIWGDFNTMLNISPAPAICQETGSVLYQCHSNPHNNSKMRYDCPFFRQVDTEPHGGEAMSGQVWHRRKDRNRIYTQVVDAKPYVLSTLPCSLSITTEITMIKITFLSPLLFRTVKCLRKVDYIRWVIFFHRLSF